jgi:hypothetical protein
MTVRSGNLRVPVLVPKVMRRTLVAAPAVVLVLAAPAGAALDARLAVTPTSPRVGAAATVTIQPYWPFSRADGSCCRRVPAKVRYPFRLQALGPSGSLILFRPQRTADPHLWRARLPFPRPGRWRIRIANYYTGECGRLGCLYRGPELTVIVRR